MVRYAHKIQKQGRGTLGGTTCRVGNFAPAGDVNESATKCHGSTVAATTEKIEEFTSVTPSYLTTVYYPDSPSQRKLE